MNEEQVEPAAEEEPAFEEASVVEDAKAPEGLTQDSYDALQNELEEALAKKDENWNMYLGAHAEMENLRKRSERDLQNAHKYAVEKIAKELLPVHDSLEMGISAAAEAHDVAKLLEGSEMTLKMLNSAMDKTGIVEIAPEKGEKFDPDQHQAMAMQPVEGAEPNTVLQVVQKGYTLNDRLIRPAMVIVAQAN